MALKSSKSIHGLEALIEEKIAELKNALKLTKKAPVTKAGPKGKAVSRDQVVEPVSALITLLKAHPQKAALIKAGKEKDQLLRSLIPLYLSQGKVEVTSGTMSRFWAKHGLKYAAPNAAKALRLHPGYARRTAKGQQITANGVKYVDQALSLARR